MKYMAGGYMRNDSGKKGSSINYLTPAGKHNQQLIYVIEVLLVKIFFFSFFAGMLFFCYYGKTNL
jgi:hypothetical protein